MLDQRERRKKEAKQILKAMKIEKLIAKYGLVAVKHAINFWARYQQEAAKITRERQHLEARLAELKSKAI